MCIGSKRGNNPAHSGIASNAKGGQIQVFHNGKIVTPQSLLPRKTASANLSNKKMTANANNQEEDNQASEEKEIGTPTPLLKDKKGSMKK